MDNAINTQSKELERLKEKLENSPLFSASLGSKELFHSNMIAWMCEQWPAKMGEVFSKLLREDVEIVPARKKRRRSRCANRTTTTCRSG